MGRFTGTFLLCAVLIVVGQILIVVARDFVQFLGLVAMVAAVIVAGCAELTAKSS